MLPPTGRGVGALLRALFATLGWREVWFCTKPVPIYMKTQIAHCCCHLSRARASHAALPATPPRAVPILRGYGPPRRRRAHAHPRPAQLQAIPARGKA